MVPKVDERIEGAGRIAGLVAHEAGDGLDRRDFVAVDVHARVDEPWHPLALHARRTGISGEPMKLDYSEGTWFAVPLDTGGFGVGVVARATTKGSIILVYLFGPKREAVPLLSEVAELGIAVVDHIDQQWR